MTEAEWLGSGDPTPMLYYLCEQNTSERKLRLLACACCRRIWHLLPDPRSRDAIEVAERFADDQATRLELARARTKAVEVKGGSTYWAAYWTANTKASGPIYNVFAAAAVPILQKALYNETDYALALQVEYQRQVSLVYEVVGNPFRQMRLNPDCLVWQGGLVRHLAEGIYEDRSFECMPILADALEDAGCDEPVIIEHCRSGCEHVRGCWVLDLILGRR